MCERKGAEKKTDAKAGQTAGNYFRKAEELTSARRDDISIQIRCRIHTEAEG